MKNRLQFNRIPTVFSGATVTKGGEQVWVSGREQAAEALENYIKRGSFIPLIGEPIVLRYTDDKGERQAMLAIGKSTGATIDMVGDRKYHIIDTAALQEGVDSATETANEAYGMASAATKDVENYLVILKNMILSGIGLSDGTYFDTDDPSGCGLYDPDKVDDTFYLKEATSFLDADKKLDAALVATNAWFNGRVDHAEQEIEKEHGYRKAIAIKEIDQQYYERLGLGDDIKAAYFLTTHKPGDGNFDQYDYPQNGEVIIKVYKDSVTPEDIENLSGITESYLNNIISGCGLNPDGTFNHELLHSESATYIDDSFSLMQSDLILDETIAELSANTIAADEGLSNAIAGTNMMLNGRCDMLQTQIDEEKTYRKSIKLRKLTPAQIEQLELGDNVLAAYDLVDHHNYAPTTAETIVKVYKDNINTLDLDYKPEENKIVLSWNDGLEDRSTYIDVSDFVKDSFLTGVEVVVSGGVKYMKFAFKTYDDKPLPIYVPIEDFAVLYDVMPESYNYLTIDNDTYKIGAKVDVEHGLAGYDTMKYISGLTENIISGAGLNLLSPGAYPGHDDTKYIKDAGSLDQADVLLDAAIWETSGLVADISNRVDTLSGVVESFSAHTVEALSALSSSVDERITSALTEISGVVETYVEEKLSGLNFDEIYEYVDNSVSALSANILTYVIENEEVTAAALNDLNERVSTVETHMNGEYIYLTGYEESSGLTEEELLVNEEDSVNDAFGKLQKQILDNEETVAAGLNDLNRRVLENKQAIEQNAGVAELSGAVVSLSAATHYTLNNITSSLTNVNNEITEIQSGLTVIESSLTIVESGLTVLSGVVKEISGLTDGVLTVELNGEVQGKYSPSADTLISLTAITEVTGADVLLTGYELSSGRTEEELAIVATDTVNEAFGKIQKQFYDNEAVVAGALNDLNDKVTNVSGSVEALELVALTGVSVDGVAQPVSNNVADLHISIPTVNSFFDGVKYDSDTKRINFYNGGKDSGTVIDYVDAAAFIKDGMVDNVVVGVPTAGTHAGETCLIITFNTDSGKEDIDIPVSEIFDPATLNELSASVVANETKLTTISGDVIALSAAVVGDVANLNELSASVVNNRTDIDTLSANIIDNEYVIAAALNDLNSRVWELSGRTVDLSNYYNKQEIDAMFLASGGNPDAAISALTQSLEELSAATVSLSAATTAISQNVTNLSAATTAISQNLTTLSGAAHTKITNLSAATTAISQNVTNLSAATTAISQNVTNLSAATTAISQNVTNLSAATTAISQNLNTLSAVVENNYYTKTQVDGMVKKQFTATTSVTNLTFEKFLTIVTLGTSTNLTITSNPNWDMEVGEVIEAHVIIQNTGSTGIIVTLPSSDSRVKITGDDELLVDPSGFGEVNAMITKTGNNTYVIYLITSF